MKEMNREILMVLYGMFLTIALTFFYHLLPYWLYMFSGISLLLYTYLAIRAYHKPRKTATNGGETNDI